MRCPACGTYQPVQLEHCFLCGETIMPPKSSRQKEEAMAPGARAGSSVGKRSKERADPSSRLASQASRPHNRPPARWTTIFGVLLTGLVLFTSAGTTIYFLTRPPDDQRLLKEGRQELAKGQYAFAVQTLSRAIASRPKDSKALLALARAYVGIDQVDKAWECISHAQQLGAGIASEPTLASDLANYYRQRAKYDKAIDLLRPLAQADLPGKKAELADLDALWGDEALRSGQVDLSLRCWEEVRDLREGSRFAEADSRLATIYQKLADTSAANNDDAQALSYLAKLNCIAENARNYSMAATIYEREGKLDLAIEQIRKALSMDSHNQVTARQLSGLLTRRGKELMDAGNNEAGYAYLQQAKSFDTTSQLPELTLRNLTVSVDSLSHCPRLSGEVWNPTDKTINSVNLRAELWDSTSEKMLWSKENKLIDEFVAPLAAKQSRAFDFIAAAAVKTKDKPEFRVYIDGALYKAYPIGTAEKANAPDQTSPAAPKDQLTGPDTSAAGPPITPAPAPLPASVPARSTYSAAPSLAPALSPLPDKTNERPSQVIEPTETNKQDGLTPKGAASAEERTMKDLDF